MAFCAEIARGEREHFHALANRRRTGRQGLRRLLYLDQAHPAGCRDAQLLVVAKPRDVGADRVGDLDNHLALARLDRLAIYFDVYDVVTHRGYAAASRESTILRPRFCTMYSNSSK